MSHRKYSGNPTRIENCVLAVIVAIVFVVLAVLLPIDFFSVDAGKGDGENGKIETLQDLVDFSENSNNFTIYERSTYVVRRTDSRRRVRSEYTIAKASDGYYLTLEVVSSHQDDGFNENAHLQIEVYTEGDQKTLIRFGRLDYSANGIAYNTERILKRWVDLSGGSSEILSLISPCLSILSVIPELASYAKQDAESNFRADDTMYTLADAKAADMFEYLCKMKGGNLPWNEEECGVLAEIDLYDAENPTVSIDAYDNEGDSHFSVRSFTRVECIGTTQISAAEDVNALTSEEFEGLVKLIREDNE